MVNHAGMMVTRKTSIEIAYERSDWERGMRVIGTVYERVSGVGV